MKLPSKTMLLTAAFLAIATVSHSQDAEQPQTPEQIEAVRKAVAAAEAAQVARPGEIMKLKDLELDAAEARSRTGYSTQQTRQLRDRRLDISAGENEAYVSQRLHLGEGDVTSLSFYDRNGDIWPIASVLYDKNHFQVNGEGCDDSRGVADETKNILYILPCRFWTTGTLQVRLDGETKPIPFDVRSGSKDDTPIVDSSVTVKVTSRASGPFEATSDNRWVRPQARRLTIDPVDYKREGGDASTIVLAPGLLTDVSFIDRTGKLWPVVEVAYAPDQIAVNGSCTNGNASGVEIKSISADVGTFYLAACGNVVTNINVRLLDRPAALSLVVVTATRDRPRADSTLTVQVPFDVAAYRNAANPEPDPQMLAATQRDRALDQTRSSSLPGYSHQSTRQLTQRALSFSATGNTPYRPQAIQTGVGDVTAVSFYDSAGSPWTAERFLFDPTKISVNGDGCQSGLAAQTATKSNVVYIRPCGFWTASTLQVHLKGNNRPIPLDVRAGSREHQPIVDGAVTANVSGYMVDDAPTDTQNKSNDWISAKSRFISVDPVAADRGATHDLIVPPGFTTNVSFVDGASQAWPIDEVAYPAGKIAINSDCEAQRSAEGGVRIFTPTSDRATIYVSSCIADMSNLNVKLRGRAAPLALIVRNATPSAPVADSTLTVEIPGVSPLQPEISAASIVVASDITSQDRGFSPDPYLDDFLDGAPLPGSRRVVVSGSRDVNAWIYNGALYVRGSIAVINPAHDAHAATSDGTMHIWKYSPPINRILAQDANGSERNVSFDF